MFDCAIIGAGLAGLSAAVELKRKGFQVVVLEARERVGGRIENRTLRDGELVELGGQWIGPGHDLMRDLVDSYGLELIGLPTRGEFTVRLQGRTYRTPSQEGTSAMTPFEVADLGQGLMRFRRLGTRLADDEAWAESNRAWLQQDLERWIATNLRTPGGQRRFREVFEAAFGPIPENASLRDGLGHAASGIDLEGLVAANGGLYQHRVQGGAAAICARMMDEVAEDVRLGAQVMRIVQRGAEATLVLVGGEEIPARRIINTMPPCLAVEIEHEPRLPDWRINLVAKVPAGHVIKAALVYDEPWWRKLGLSGQMGSDEGAVRVTLDTTGADSRRGVLLGFFEGTEAADLSGQSTAVRRQAFVDSVVRAFGQVAANPSEYVERDWASEEFTGGCHGAHFAPGVWTASGPQLAVPEGVEYFAGSEYSPKFNGYMEGAVRSGREVAAAVARDLI